MVGVFFDEFGQRLFVDLTDVGRDVVEGLVPPQLLARRGAAALIGERFLGLVALEGEWRSRIAP
jgi:hypothetical protein